MAVAFLFDFSPAVITGMYAGATTNTPAMAGVIDYINSTGPLDRDSLIEQIVVGYSFSYPMGVLGGMIAIVFTERMLRIEYQKESEQLKHEYPIGENISTRTILVTNQEGIDIPLRDLYNTHDWEVVFGKVERDENIRLINWSSCFTLGDRVYVIGNEEELDNVESVLGEKTTRDLSSDPSKYDTRRIFVSNPDVVGMSLSALQLDRQYDCIITRIRRGDVEMLAKGDTILELGDRILFVARQQDLEDLSRLFGDSYTDSAKVNLFTFGIGIGLGFRGLLPIRVHKPDTE